MRRALASGLVLALLALGWLFTAPRKVRARRWSGLPKPPSSRTGPYVWNGALRRVTPLARMAGWRAPESSAVDAQGRIYAGFDGGAIVRWNPEGQQPQVVASTGGRPLGLRFHPNGDLLIADPVKGLFRLTPAGTLEFLTNTVQGEAIGFLNDLDIEAGGRYVYLSDTSTKFGLGEGLLDMLEHGGHGRFLRHDLHTGQTEVLRGGLNFPNGVCISADQSYVLLGELATASILRLWLTGERAGTWDTFAENLPGYPDNIRRDDQGLYWVALPSRRSPLTDATGGLPWVRDLLARLIARVPFPLPKDALLLALNGQGQPVHFASDTLRGAYHYVTQVLPHGDDLLLSSIEQDTLVCISRQYVPRVSGNDRRNAAK